MYRTVYTCTEHCTYVHNTVHKYLSQLYNCCDLNLQIDSNIEVQSPIFEQILYTSRFPVAKWM